ncbi:nitrogenase cofactor biosynthesis protein NifB [Sporomusa termitida]|uniref:FeMo cofactor biosynthesis protein NifB n=1 Tax=Sporomusa termitida TaxID=2377 RepID=A0A517DR79_9FIRM|nr:nitrogenase cofactor biosynthesis protein NifB [Sporomusa termitida]QDR79861.1 FeMo cofactor biosynthesis protein NifB [Sporomusa termitida]
MEKQELAEITAKHPCYSFAAHHKYARMHLPVAPSCNISCNYCNRKYDCVNESRPGVTSEILTPAQSLAKFIRVKAELPHLSVVGIAGPGDALANWEAVTSSIQLIKAEAPAMIFCLSTNGLMLPHYWQDIIDLGINHVTVTVNCLEPAIGAGIYRHIHYQGKYYVGENAAELLIGNQLTGIKLLADHGILVKVNIVMIKGINDEHIPAVVKKVKSLGALMTNIMPLIPAPGSVFQGFSQTSRKEVDAMRDLCQTDLTQMRHCQQCRADAIGLLAEDQSHKFRSPKPESVKKCNLPARVYKIAVTSKYKKLVDLHYGHAAEFHIYETDGRDTRFIETRPTQKYCLGVATCEETEAKKDALIEGIADCDAVLTMRIGYEAQKRLLGYGIPVAESCASIEEGLQQAFQQLRQAEQPGAVCSGL